MKIDIITESRVRKIVKEEQNKKLGYLEKEIDKLRQRIQLLQDEIKIIQNKK